MSTPPKKHNCPILDLFKGCGCGTSSKPEQPSCGCGDHSHDRDHAHEAGHSHDSGHAHGHHHDHEHPHVHPHGGHDHGASGGQEHSHAHGHDHAHNHKHDQEHGHSHEAAAAPAADGEDKAEDSNAAADGQLEVSAEQEQALRADLEAFENEPAEFMDRLPLKRTEQQGATPEALPLFSPEALESKAYVGARDELRTLLDSDEEKRAAIASNDQARNLVDSYVHTSLQSMQASGLMRARLSVTPWSDDYWGLYLGCLGKRYADPGFPHSQDWQENYSYVQSRPASGIVSSGSAAAVNQLSPSEKYDILIGDSSFSLTRQMWADGERYQQQYGHVETWMGICHGWAPASYMAPRPAKAVTLTAADGRTQLTFYPSDIKALASLLWAKASPSVKFIGGRCNVPNPERDEIGRVIAQDCFDTNPGTWHLAVVNQLGASKRSMVMDVTFDYQVWNQPVVGYRYYHFNPKSMTYQSAISAAAVPRANFTNDKFARYRSSQTASVIGIEMYVSYTVETAPSHSMTDSPGSDAVQEVRYLYDLELDISGKIIGGEWRSKAHPDFLWTPPKGSQAQGGGSGVPQADVVARLINLANS
uniref:hypothetical protein n=1 Tax=Candidatus Electronema sp. TaxID=2698783 RepID=UPI0040573C22